MCSLTCLLLIPRQGHIERTIVAELLHHLPETIQALACTACRQAVLLPERGMAMRSFSAPCAQGLSILANVKYLILSALFASTEAASE